MSPEEFTKDEQKRLELGRVLENPVLQEALSVLRQELEPKSLMNEATGNPVLGASKYQQMVGANHIIFGLQKLTTPILPPKRLTGKPLERE